MPEAINNDWVLEPFIRVGIFPLGKQISSDFTKKFLEESSDEETANENDTKFNILDSNAFLTIDENGLVKHVNCDDQCNFKGVNLIGKPLEEVESLLGYEAVAYLPDIIVGVYDVDEIGVMLWVDNDGLVKTVDCGMYIDPDEI
jgi:hypothetical protein